jgi:threonine aldolase
VHPEDVETNIMVVTIDIEKLKIDGAKFIELLREKGILVLPRGADAVRFVLHRDIDDDDIKASIDVIADIVSKNVDSEVSLPVTPKSIESIAG